jgi:hypothetical protein
LEFEKKKKIFFFFLGGVIPHIHKALIGKHNPKKGGKEE